MKISIGLHLSVKQETGISVEQQMAYEEMCLLTNTKIEKPHLHNVCEGTKIYRNWFQVKSLDNLKLIAVFAHLYNDGGPLFVSISNVDVDKYKQLWKALKETYNADIEVMDDSALLFAQNNPMLTYETMRSLLVE